MVPVYLITDLLNQLKAAYTDVWKFTYLKTKFYSCKFLVGSHIRILVGLLFDLALIPKTLKPVCVLWLLAYANTYFKIVLCHGFIFKGVGWEVN